MTESSTESSTSRYDTSAIELADAPEDQPEDSSVGYAVYDRVLRRFVGPVSSDKPKLADVKREHGHDALAIVRV